MRKIFVTIGGVLLILFGLFHLSFWSLFDWENELVKLNPANSNIMQMLNIGSFVILFSLGFILLYLRKEILSTQLGRAILFVSSLFFFARLIMEFVFKKPALPIVVVLFICVLVYLIPALTCNKKEINTDN